jgi:transcriptional regulator with XRE-family HTH domain
MAGFSERLRVEIDYAGYNQKEFAAKAGIKKRALDAYLGVQQSMPPADVAVKIASALGLTVEYLVTGKEGKRPGLASLIDITKYRKFQDFLNDVSMLPDDIYHAIKAMVKILVKRQKNGDRTGDRHHF